MLDLWKYFGKNLFNGHDFLQVYEPVMEGVSNAEGLWENLTSEEKDIPPLEDTVTTETVGTGTQVGTHTITTPPSESEIAEWNAKHAPWKKDSNMLKGFMQLTMTREMYIPIKDMMVADAWDYLKETYGRPTLSNIYGDFLKATTSTINQNNPLDSIAKLCTYFEHLNTVNVNILKLDDLKTDQKRKDAEPGRKPALILDCVQDAIMVKFEQLNPQFASRLTAVKHSGTNAPLFQQQQFPRPPQHQQQCGQQQQWNNQQQRALPSNQDTGKKKQQQ
ncbi:hypothetical protein PQX77_021699 [Marasmius sp. AFHP31]|nr:hypothetical protein PQX77_021699 [Marasmius sp. AFHP31]